MGKKAFFIIFLSFVFTQALRGQTEIGLMFSPTLSANRVAAETDTYGLTPGGAKLKLSISAIADLFLRENYYFSTGLTLAPKSITVEYVPLNGTGKTSESFRMQYLQIPATLKLYTNELALDRRIFVQFGFLNEINIDRKPKSDDTFALQKFRLFDFSLLFRGGLDFQLGYNTSMFGGVSYSRGLVNVLRRHHLPDESFKIKNDLIGIDLGIRF